METLNTLVVRGGLTGARNDQPLSQLLTEVANAIALGGQQASTMVTQLGDALHSSFIMTKDGEVLVLDGEVLRNSIRTAV